MGDLAVRVEDLGQRYRIGARQERHDTVRDLIASVARAPLRALRAHGAGRADDVLWALQGVSFSIKRGEVLGIIGRNGAGKSTLLKILSKVTRPTTGRAEIRGRVGSLLEVGTGFHPELTGRENIYLNGAILGMKKAEIRARFDDIVAFADLEQFLDTPVKRYSSGMYMRLAFSIAAHLEPDILAVDEVLAVGDAVFQRRCNEKFADFRRSGKTVVIVSHAADAMRTMCDRVAWLQEGRVVSEGRSEDIVDDYVDEGHEDRVEVAPEVAEHRWGSGEVRLTAVELVDAGGRQVTHPSTGDAVTFRLRYRAEKAIAKPVFGLALETLDGTWLWAHHTRDAGFVPDEIAGEGAVDLHVPRLMLQPGTYDLSASVVDYTTTHQYDYLRRCLRFDVEHGDPRESGGYVALGGQWSSASFDP